MGDFNLRQVFVKFNKARRGRLGRDKEGGLALLPSRSHSCVLIIASPLLEVTLNNRPHPYAPSLPRADSLRTYAIRKY